MVTCPRLSSGKVRWISFESAAARTAVGAVSREMVRMSISNCTCRDAPGYQNFDERPSAAGERLPHAGNQCFNLVAILFVLPAKLLNHKGLLQVRFVSPTEHHQRGRDQSGYLAK